MIRLALLFKKIFPPAMVVPKFTPLHLKALIKTPQLTKPTAALQKCFKLCKVFQGMV